MKRILRVIPMLGHNPLLRIAKFMKEWEGALWLAGAIGVVLIGGILAWWFWDKIGGDAESFSTTLRNVALVIGGIAAILLAVWRSRVSERQTAIAQRQAETALRQAEIAQHTLLSERYQRGTEMLGREILSVRLGGIYALQQLAEDYPEQYHIRIMRLFCAFVRLPTRDQSLEPGQAVIEPGTLLGIRHDVEAVMQMIGSRDKSRIALERKADFRLDLRGANLPTAQFLSADLSNAMFHNSKLSGANFANTDLTDSFLSYSDLSKAQFHNVTFTRTRLWSANLSCAMLQDADLSRKNFHNVNLSGANLLRANLSGAIFQDAKASNALLERANLSLAGFLRADLSGAWLVMADMSGAHFSDADLTSANIAEANLSGVKFSGGGLQTAQGLTQAQLDDARADPNDPPELTGVLDPGSGEPLVWRGKGLNEEA